MLIRSSERILNPKHYTGCKITESYMMNKAAGNDDHFMGEMRWLNDSWLPN